MVERPIIVQLILVKRIVGKLFHLWRQAPDVCIKVPWTLFE